MKKRLKGMKGVLCTLATLTLFVIALIASEPKRSFADSRHVLSFQQRVAYQHAIEEVYWRHRIWPKECPDPKPSLDAVMSQAKLEEKVAGYLRKSQALDDYWQQPITAEQLQAEMDRMGQNTKQPEVLRELFEALGNDPLVVAECLARPVLAERLTADFSAQDKTGYFKPARTKGLRGASIATTIRNAAYNLPTISEEGDPSRIDDAWIATSISGAPLPRSLHTVVWTGSEMIIFGGYFQFSVASFGARYNLATDSWTTINGPSARCLHTAVWTGREMIVWGGGSILLGGHLNTGERYDPTTDSWTATSTTNVPLARYYHSAVWTGSEMVVWGGYNVSELNTGGRVQSYYG